MIAASTNTPISYLNTHLSGGQTRASAIVATEPVAKHFEMRQEKYKQILRKVYLELCRRMGKKPGKFEIVFPEIVTQDRSIVIKDLMVAQTMKWLSPKQAAEKAAKEFEFDDYDFDETQAEIKDEASLAPQNMAPLTMPGLGRAGGAGQTLNSNDKQGIANEPGS